LVGGGTGTGLVPIPAALGGGTGTGLVPIPKALGGGTGTGLVPIPAALGGGTGTGLVPMPATPLRIETPPRTTNRASANARKLFFTAFLPEVNVR